MLDYMVAMLIRFLSVGMFTLFCLLLDFANPGRISAQDVLVVIYAPLPGQAVQGQLPVDVGIVAPGYSRVELQFSYSIPGMNTWFLIAESDQIPFDGILAYWDTAAITDGQYDLRLVAIKENGETIQFDVPGLRVRNYTPVETNTPSPPRPTLTLLPGRLTPLPTLTSTTLPPTMTPLPTNPAIFTDRQFIQGASAGGMVVLGLLAAFGIYTAVGAYRRNRM